MSLVKHSPTLSGREMGSPKSLPGSKVKDSPVTSMDKVTASPVHAVSWTDVFQLGSVLMYT